MIRLLIAGDYSPKTRVAELIEKGEHASVFSEVKKLTSEMDYSVVNFESTITAEGDEPILKSGPNLSCSTRSASVIREAGFDMVTLANNHFSDYGDKAVLRSLKYIEEAGLDHVGGGTKTQAAEPLLKEIGGKMFAFINCCEHEFTIADEERLGCNPLNPIQQFYQIKEVRNKVDYVIVIVHGGHEHFQLPSLRMQETYRFFIDAGADVVVNHHQHCYSGYETWHGKPIFYGLGNFCFDYGQGRPSTWYEGYALEIDFSDKKIDFKLYPFVQGREQPNVSFMKDRKAFDEKIKELNTIIADEEKLKEANRKYYDECSAGILNTFVVHARFVRHFPRIGALLFPSGIKCRRYDIKNLIFCEAHLDKFRYAMKKITPAYIKH